MKKLIILSIFITALSCRSTQPFITGADVSWIPEHESKGVKFSDNGIQKDVFEILSDNKFNYIRLRLFVNPSAEKGYSKDGYCDLEHTLMMAKRIRNAKMKFLLDFHYSDNWADPGKQAKPAAWVNLEGDSLAKAVCEYTKQTIAKFKEQGTMPDMVQIGNEINHGMLWPSAKIDSSASSWANLCVLLRAASEGVRAVDPKIKIMIHIACGGQNKESVYFFDKMNEHGVNFDVIGESYYPKYHGTLDDLQSNLNDLVSRYNKPIFVVEYSEKREEVNNIVHSIPNAMGLGTFIWEATSPQWGGLFDKSGATTDAMKIYPELYMNFKKNKR